MSFALSENERLLSNLIRVGTISELDQANARVTVKIGALTTDWLPWITARAGATRTWSAPRAGEQVLVLSPYGDPAQGLVLPAIYQDAHPAPATSQDLERVTFPDGSQVTYDSAGNTLTVDVAGAGNVVVNCKHATVNAADDATINTNVAALHASTSTTIDSPTTTVTGQLIVQGLLTYMAGLVGQGAGGGAGAVITGNVAFSGGSLTHGGVNVGKTHSHTEQGDGQEVSAPH